MPESDPISDATPAKRRKLNNNDGAIGKLWDSDQDSGDELFGEHETVATLPLEKPIDKTQKAELGYNQQQFSDDLHFSSSIKNPTYTTQPTQPLTRATQPTQILPPRSSSPQLNDVQVERSSPTASEPTQRMPPPTTKGYSRLPSFLASAMAPRGTAYRRPLNTQTQREIVNIDSDDDDPPIEHSSDDESRSLVSNIKPTKFINGKRTRDSPPRQVIQDSPRATAPQSHMSEFSKLLSEYKHAEKQGDDMASAYGSSSRAARPQPQKQQQQKQTTSSLSGSQYQTLDDIHDWNARKKVERIQNVLGKQIPVARCFDALKRKHYNYEDALSWLVETGIDEVNEIDELAPTPMKAAAAKGIAMPTTQTSFTSKPSTSFASKPSARQDVKVPAKTIAERYAAQNARKQSQAQTVSESQDEPIKPRRRLLQGRRQRSPSPVQQPTSTARSIRRAPVVTIDDDDEDSDDVATVESAAEEPSGFQTSQERRLLKYFNECSVQELIDLSAQPEDAVRFVIEQRPFTSLDQVRAVSNTETKGKKSRTRAIGDKIVDICTEVWSGYDAVDELVDECEKLAKPIQATLKSWGVGQSQGELQMMKLDEAHDSGIGTPTSSCPPDDAPTSSNAKAKSKGSRFLSQPENMSPDLVMKDYQLVGLNWLNLLWSKKFSCILADDMGLGKTCQIIAFLSHLQSQNVDGVHLVIVPGSTLENWLREFQNFAPELNVFPYYGSQSQRPELQDQIEEEFSSIDVIVTTYDMAVRDNQFVRKLGPSVCVYDEAHQLRNPKSDRYKSLMRIPADFKVLLTGTPLQNNLQELIAILAFIMPDMFSAKREELEYIFQHKASTKNADHAALLSAQRIQRARSMITPFILRRKKAQVLDLPTKHSRVEYCDLTDTQIDVYCQVDDEARQLFAEKASGKKLGTKASSNVLMSLRKAAIHPLLTRRIYDDKKIDKIVNLLSKHEEFRGNPLDKIRKYVTGEDAISLGGTDFSLHRFCSERDYLHKYALKKDEWMDSGKVQLLAKLVQGYAKNGDRALVFSQFTMVMYILEAVMETLGIKYMRLDGSTKMEIRQDMIDKFSNEQDITVFMLSTKAGGAGINLAAANKVVIFDSGFNPQDDIQAENRAHRVGQTREVEVVRLVTRSTIEEQIHALGESKLALDERVAGEGASAAEDKAAEKAGTEAVERMLMGSARPRDGVKKEEDLKDAYKKGLEDAGLRVD